MLFIFFAVSSSRRTHSHSIFLVSVVDIWIDWIGLLSFPEWISDYSLFSHFLNERLSYHIFLVSNTLTLVSFFSIYPPPKMGGLEFIFIIIEIALKIMK